MIDELQYKKLEQYNKLIELKRQQVILDFRQNPTFYKFCILTSAFHQKCKDIPYIREMCDTLELFIDNQLLNSKGKPYFGLGISLPPGHGKTLTGQLLSTYYFYKKNELVKICNFSYSMDNAKNSCMGVRDKLLQQDTDNKNLFTAQELFGKQLQLRRDLKKKTEWSIEGQNLISYACAAPRSGITGKRFEILLYDDIVKNSTEALNETYLDYLYNTFYQNDTLTRLEDRTENTHCKVILLQTQWAEKDLIGILSKDEYKDKYKFIKYPALINFDDVYKRNAEPKMLNKIVYDFNSFDFDRKEAEKNTISKAIFYCLNQQKIISIQDALYSFGDKNFYNTIPSGYSRTVACIDTAKGGADSNALWIAKQINDMKLRKKQLYILDAYAKSGDSKTCNREMALLLKKHSVQEVWVEINSGGDKDIIMLKDALKEINYNCSVKSFYQKNNKESRIFSYASYIQEDVFFPSNFKEDYEEIWKHLKTFKTTFKNNIHDDIEDCLTALYEKYGNMIKNTHTINTLNMLSNM